MSGPERVPTFRATRVPGLFCPGTPLRTTRQRLEPGRLYGLAALGDWITVMRREDGWHWRAMRAGNLGVGTRGDFETYLAGLPAAGKDAA